MIRIQYSANRNEVKLFYRPGAFSYCVGKAVRETGSTYHLWIFKPNAEWKQKGLESANYNRMADLKSHIATFAKSLVLTTY